ncbi:MAG: hypothetical protein QM754_14210 [Tepidisphaeraceae bacterium]
MKDVLSVIQSIDCVLSFGATYVGKRGGPGRFSDINWLLVALSFCMAGVGLILFGSRTSRVTMMLAGIGLAAMPFLFTSFFWLGVSAGVWVFVAIILATLTGR